MPSPPPRRAWGTRYDSLVEPQVSGSPVASSPDVSLPSRDITASLDVEHDQHATHATAAAEKERAKVGEDDYMHSLSSSGTLQGNVDAISPAQARMPHDASVFVASLPSHIPEAELHALLSEHLSRHATIKNVKLIRDNRGTVCAFVQVETASQASDLISACNLSHFMDRHIRCERARAFRTLLISWRPPTSPAQGTNETQTNIQEGKEDRPFRLRRCRGTKYIQVTHGSDALSSDPVQLPNYNSPRTDDPLSGSGLLFPEGLKEGDLKALKSLLEAFGPLEFITPFDSATQPPVASHFASEPQSREEGAFMRGGSTDEPTKDGGDDESEQSRAQRPMWAVKWEHRNDAVSAITALQYIPSIFVCWSHTYGRPHHPPCGQYGPYGHSRNSSGFYTQPSYSPTPFTIDSGGGSTTPAPAHATRDVDGESDAQWAVVPLAAGVRLQQLHAQAPIIPKIEQQQTPITFSESDFPPLSGDGGGAIVGRGRGKRGAWLGRRNFVRAGAPSPPPISTTLAPTRLNAGPTTPTSVVPHTPDLESAIEPSPITPGFPVTPRTPSGGYGPPSQSDEIRKDAMYASSQGYNVPYAASGYTTPSATRQSYVVQQGFTGQYAAPHNFPPRRPFEDGSEKVYDGRELFIGGLDMETWDEEKVRSVFEQYGTIEEMRFVKPGYHAPVHRRAFAFVKFTDQEAPQRAIKEEHLRVYDDRKIKVQLRDANPPKRWGYRGRARFHHGLLRADRGSLDFDRDSCSGEALAGAEEGCEPEDGAHVRFASAPEVGRVKVQDTVELEGKTSENVAASSSALDVAVSTAHAQAEDSINGLDTTHEVASASSSCSDGAPNASMEVQTHSADTTLTLADITVSPASPPASLTHHELQSEPDSQTVTSTPPPSNPDATSVYAPSSAGSAPTSSGYYAQTPSWIPPYAIPPTPYGPYGYYPQQVANQPAADGSNPYPWMAALYRNVVPFVPWFNPPPGVELAPAPVRPTGYIQREPGGIFIPVYPPERLGQYMSTSGTEVDQSQAQSQPASGASPVGNWQNLPPHPQLYPVPFPMQQPMMIPQQGSTNGHQSQHQHQQQVPMTGNGWITGPPLNTAYPTQHAPSSAPPPYPAPNSYYPSQAPTVPTNSRPGMYGQYDTTMHQTPMKNSHRRGGEYGHQQHRTSGSLGPREGRLPHQRRGPGGVGMNGAADQSFSAGAVDPHWQIKPNSALPAQLAMSTSGNVSQWN